MDTCAAGISTAFESCEKPCQKHWTNRCKEYLCLGLFLFLTDMSRVGAVSTDGAQAILRALWWGAGLSLNAGLHAGRWQWRGLDGSPPPKSPWPAQPTSTTGNTPQGPEQNSPGAQPQQDPSRGRDWNTHTKGPSPHRSQCRTAQCRCYIPNTTIIAGAWPPPHQTHTNTDCDGRWYTNAQTCGEEGRVRGG